MQQQLTESHKAQAQSKKAMRRDGDEYQTLLGMSMSSHFRNT